MGREVDPSWVPPPNPGCDWYNSYDRSQRTAESYFMETEKQRSEEATRRLPCCGPSTKKPPRSVGPETEAQRLCAETVGLLTEFPREVLLNLLEYSATANRNYVSELMHKVQLVSTNNDVQFRSIHSPDGQFQGAMGVHW